ncbi:MAG: DUF3313 domain-containing protein [Gammaproteobacteria bacterium]|nr:DUF3313 domain-containing protein [Gammaproteobacteria bacterium]
MLIRNIIVACIILLILSPLLIAKEKHERSGFLENYPNFERNKETGAEVWFKSKKEGVKVLKPYRKILLSPVEIWLTESSHKGINPDALKAMTDYFTIALHEKLKYGYEFVDQPGPGVLHLRIAITNVTRTKPKRKWYGYVPVALVVSGAKKVAQSAAGETVDLVEASIELEGLDSVSEERIVAAIDTHQSSKVKREKGSANWTPMKEILDHWAEKISERMDEARGLL